VVATSAASGGEVAAADSGGEVAGAVGKTIPTVKEIQPPNEKVLWLVEQVLSFNLVEFISLEKSIREIYRPNEPQPIQNQTQTQTQAQPEIQTKPAVPEVPKEEEFTKSASVKLISYPETAKINVLRELRKLKPGMNIMESKKLVENLPQILQKNVLPDELKEWKKQLEGAGAKIEFV